MTLVQAEAPSKLTWVSRRTGKIVGSQVKILGGDIVDIPLVCFDSIIRLGEGTCFEGHFAWNCETCELEHIALAELLDEDWDVPISDEELQAFLESLPSVPYSDITLDTPI